MINDTQHQVQTDGWNDDGMWFKAAACQET